MSFFISGFQKSTLIDFPDKIACIIFTNGCNFRCGYCHNPELFNQREPILEVSAFFDFLKTRINKLDGVVITGGEPTLQKDLETFIEQIKSLNFAVKLDTNGSNPELLENLLKNNLLDYVAMDIKAPLEKYNEITNSNVNIDKIKTSINLLLNSNINYEFRTTVVKSQLEKSDILKIGELIKGAKNYYLQEFLPTKTLDENFMNEKSYTKEEFEGLKNELKILIQNVDYR